MIDAVSSSFREERLVAVGAVAVEAVPETVAEIVVIDHGVPVGRVAAALAVGEAGAVPGYTVAAALALLQYTAPLQLNSDLAHFLPPELWRSGAGSGLSVVAVVGLQSREMP